jgi:site-specific DNA recombinase
MSLVLRKPVYMAKIRLGATDKEPALLVDAIHEPIVSEKEFLRVQEILTRNMTMRNKPPVYSKYENLPLRGMLLCSKCGEKVTGSGSRSRNGKRHFYYHCNHCRKERYPAEKVNRVVENMVGEFKLSKPAKQLLQEVLKRSVQKSGQSKQQQQKKWSKIVLEQKSRLKNLQDLFVDGNMAPNDYHETRDRYQSLLQEAQQNLASLNVKKTDSEALLLEVLKKVKRLDLLYKQANTRQKQ